MLKGISPLFSPELLTALYRMGQDDEILLADAHLPGHRLHQQVIRADGVAINDLLAAILPLFELDQYVDQPILIMAPVPGDEPDPNVPRGYQALINTYCSQKVDILYLERFAFYERARASFAIVMMGDTRKYAHTFYRLGR